MKESVTKTFKKIYNFLSNYFFGIIVAFIFGCVITYNMIEDAYKKNESDMKINAVRYFIEHPSEYKLDTLYRKTNDTLFIDTIKVNYINTKNGSN